MSQVVEKIIDFYRGFDQEPWPGLAEIYADNVVFQDPLHRIEGLSALTRYFEGTTKNINYCRFDIHDHHESAGTASLFWVMNFSHPRLKKGKPLTLEGMSHLRFDEKINFHRDYYDMGEMLYEHIPLLGALVRRLKVNIASAGDTNDGESIFVVCFT